MQNGRGGLCVRSVDNGSACKKYDNGKARETTARFFLFFDGGKCFPTVVYRSGYHGGWKSVGRYRAGGAGRGGLAQLADAWCDSGVDAGVWHSYGTGVWCGQTGSIARVCGKRSGTFRVIGSAFDGGRTVGGKAGAHAFADAPEIIEFTLLYLRIMFAGVPIVMLYNLLACILRSLGDSRTPLNAMIVASLTNIALDCLFVLGFHWGIAGAAVATLIAQAVSGGFCFFYIKRLTILKLTKEDFRLREDLTKKLIFLGLPMAFQNGIIAVGGMIVQFVVNTYGVLFIAGFTATNKLYGLLEIAGTSYGYAMVTYVGQNLGAGRMDRIRSGMRSAMGIAMATSVVIAICMLVFGKGILGLFISGSPEVVEQTMQIAYFYLAVMSVCLPILYVLHVTRSALQGMGNTVLPMLSGVAEFVMRTLAVVFLPMLFGESGIFFAEILAWLGADVVLVGSYFVVAGKLEKKMTELVKSTRRPW